METQTTEQVKQETKKKDYKDMDIAEMIREMRKDPEVMQAAKKIAAM